MFYVSARRSAALFAALAVPTLLLTGCGGGGGTTTGGTAPTRNATTPIYLTDAPLLGADSVNVTISKIEARTAGNGFVDLGFGYSGNLLDLRSTEALLGEAKLPAGQYTGLRLTVQSATITINGQTFPLEPVQSLGGSNGGNGQSQNKPSAAQGKNGQALARKHSPDITVGADGRSATLLINAPFTVDETGAGSALLLDFNVAHSVVATGNGRYLLKPVIPVVRKEESGEVAGTVALEPAPAAGVEEPEVEIAAAPAGQADAVQNATVADSVRKGGKFRIPALPRGIYDVTLTAQGYAPVTIPSVQIVPGQKPDLGKIILRKP